MMLKKSGVDGTLANVRLGSKCGRKAQVTESCLLYTSDAADE